MTWYRPRQGTGVMKTSMLHSHTKLQRTVVHTHTELYTLYTIIHYYTLLYKVSPPPPRRWPGEQRGGGGRGGWAGGCVPRPHICSTHQRCIQAYITLITIYFFSSISHGIALYVPIRTPIAIAATTFEIETTRRWVTLLHWFWFAADQPRVCLRLFWQDMHCR